MIALTGCSGPSDAKEETSNSTNLGTQIPSVSATEDLQEKVPGFKTAFAPFHGDSMPIELPSQWGGHGGWSVAVQEGSEFYAVLGENIAFLAPSGTDNAIANVYLADSTGDILYDSGPVEGMDDHDVRVITKGDKRYLVLTRTETNANPEAFKRSSSFQHITVLGQDGVVLIDKDLKEGEHVSGSGDSIEIMGDESYILDPETRLESPTPKLDGYSWMGNFYGQDLFVTETVEFGVSVTNGDWVQEIGLGPIPPDGVHTGGQYISDERSWIITYLGRFIQYYSKDSEGECVIMDPATGEPVDILGEHLGTCVLPESASSDGNLLAFSNKNSIFHGMTPVFTGVATYEDRKFFVANQSEYDDIDFLVPSNGETAYGISDGRLAEINLHESTGLTQISQAGNVIPEAVTDGGLAVVSTPFETHFFVDK